MKEKHSAKFIRQRKMMLVLPILVLPFITMGFWAMGGGQTAQNENAAEMNKGLNLQLPDAHFREDSTADKLAFYNQADADSLKRAELLRNDPYYKDSIGSRQNLLLPDTGNFTRTNPISGNLNNSPYTTSPVADEQKIYQKINEINKQLNQAPTPPLSLSKTGVLNSGRDSDWQFSTEVDRLQNMMQQMNSPTDADPEMEQLNTTLEKIMDIQHPERVTSKLKIQSQKNKEQVYVVTKQFAGNHISLLDTGKAQNSTENKFYSIVNDADIEDPNTIEAVVHQTQTLVNGAIIQLRLVDDVYVNGSLIPKGNFVFGTAELNNERVEIKINAIRNNHSLFPVKLEVFDLDGLAGIYIPDAMGRDMAKQSADNGLQLMELTSLDPSFKAQAASTGIHAAKSLLSKKVKQVKVLVKAGYKVLLRDKSIEQ